MKRIYLKPQKKNPLGFTINQHVFPSASIARFARANGRISLFDIKRNKLREAKPDDPVFCAKRAWDHRAETLFMRKIEDEFQNLARKIIDGTLSGFGANERHSINLFYALWYVRSRQRTLPAIEIQAKGLLGSSLTIEQEENLEKNCYAFARADGKFLAHHINGIQIQVKTGQFARTFLKESNWGIIQAQTGEFIVPDVPSHFIVPLTPILCLMHPMPNGTVTEHALAELNRSVRAASHEYFFGRDLASCPF
jgi:hypothetical protein